jgi:hypothetical protein
MKQPIRFLLLSIFVLLLTSCTRAASTPNAATICKMNLEITVRQGTNAQYRISGQVRFESSTWANFEGKLAQSNGKSVPISFSFDGKAIHFLLQSDRGRIFGTGMMDSSLANCTGSGGGTLSGPIFGDTGDWRGSWIKENNPHAPEQPQPQTQLQPVLSILPCCIGALLPLVIWVLIPGVVFLLLMIPLKKTRSPNTKAVSHSL